MRSRSSVTLVVLAFVLSVEQPAAQAQTAPAEDRAAIAALIEEVETANNAGDVERWVSFFARDFVYMAPGAAAVSNRKDLVEVAKAGFRHQATIVIETLEIQVLGRWAFARNSVTGRVTLHGSGNVVRVDVKQLVIYSKDEQGTWRIARLMSNSNSQ